MKYIPKYNGIYVYVLIRQVFLVLYNITKIINGFLFSISINYFEILQQNALIKHTKCLLI